jgi:hypothetical protein
MQRLPDQEHTVAVAQDGVGGDPLHSAGFQHSHAISSLRPASLASRPLAERAPRRPGALRASYRERTTLPRTNQARASSVNGPVGEPSRRW